MEISSKNDDKAAIETAKHEDTRAGAARDRKTKPARPQSQELRGSLSASDISTWNSSYLQKIKQTTYPEPSPLLYQTLTASRIQRQPFLRPTEHILGTFCGIVSLIDEGQNWDVLNSENLPIYFVRVSIKNVKYPFRILVIDNEIDRVVDFIVNSNTTTHLKEDVVFWEYKDSFKAQFQQKSHAFQFHDTISRMISTIKKGEQLEHEHADKMLSLDVHLPNNHVTTYQFLRSTKLKDILKCICKKEQLRMSDHHLSYTGNTGDDAINMELRVDDIRSTVLKLVSNRDLRRSSNEMISEKVSIKRPSKKSGRFFSLLRSRFSRKSKGSRMYRSAPSVLQYTDNIIMVERQPEQKKSENGTRNYSTLPVTAGRVQGDRVDGPAAMTVGRIKRRAPQPPKLFIPKAIKETETEKKVKRRAPSPPRPPEPELPPVFIAPPPPDTEPPPIDECDTPVGPIDTDLDGDSVSTESPDPNRDISETNSTAEKVSLAEDNVENGTKDETAEDMPEENVPEKNAESEKDKEKDDSNQENNEKISGSLVAGDNTNEVSANGQTEQLSDEESKFREALKNLSPEQLQALLNSKDNPKPNQQEPANVQNQQFIAMHQQQQFLSNLLLQQMIQQQMTAQQQRPQPSVVPVVPMPTVMHSPPPMVGGMVHPLQPGAMMPGYPHSAWGGMLPGQTASPGLVPGATTMLPVSPMSPLQVNSVSPGTEVTVSTESTEVKKDEPKPEPVVTEEKKEPPTTETESVESKPPENEDLVNRPLFKKMLAQVSQGKSINTPNDESPPAKAGAEVPMQAVVTSPTTKIGKVPTSYVESAEKSTPPSKTERHDHVTLGQIGKKSSYVDSAEKSTPPSITEKHDHVTLSQVGRKSSYVDSAIEKRKTSDVVPAADRASIRLTQETLSEERKVPEVHSERTSETKQVDVHQSSVKVPEDKIYTPIKLTNEEIAVAKSKQTAVSTALNVKNSPSERISYPSRITPVKLQVEKPLPEKPFGTSQNKSPNAVDVKYSALSQILANKAASLSANYGGNPSMSKTTTPLKVEPEKKLPPVSVKPPNHGRVIFSLPTVPQSTPPKQRNDIMSVERPVILSQSTTRHGKLNISSPKVVTKPGYSRQTSEPLVSGPSVAAKPVNRTMAQRKTVPTTGKDNVGISLSLSPEEMKLAQKLSVIGTSGSQMNKEKTTVPRQNLN